jgi:mannitol-1-phosphate 5-dehydrogenase
MIPFSPFAFYIRRKLFMHNMSHALTAYLGALKGYEYIWQANADYDDIRTIARNALEEISKAMSKEYNVSFSELEVFFYDLILRYDNKLLGDTIARVGKDSKRKLSKNDRFVGAIRLCQKHGIVPANIARGMAAGFLFCPEGDKESVEVATYTKENGVFAALDKYCGIKQTEEVAFMIAKEYENLKNY